jgi:uncharacterized protein (DUF983 family)
MRTLVISRLDQRGCRCYAPDRLEVEPTARLAQHLYTKHSPCGCGHQRSAHRHYRPGRDCALCDCRRYRAGAAPAGGRAIAGLLALSGALVAFTAAWAFPHWTWLNWASIAVWVFCAAGVARARIGRPGGRPLT